MLHIDILIANAYMVRSGCNGYVEFR